MENFGTQTLNGSDGAPMTAASQINDTHIAKI
jgi:hypothetical protein